MKSAHLLRVAATVSLLLVHGPRLQAQTPTGLSALTGEWTLNREKSDNPQEKIAAAMKPPTESTDKQTVTTRQRAGTTVRTPPPPLGAASNQSDDRGIYRSATREVVFGGESLHIGTTEDAVVIQSPGGPALSLKANGKKENIQRFGAAEAMTKAEWKKDKLTIETDANDGLRNL